MTASLPLSSTLSALPFPANYAAHSGADLSASADRPDRPQTMGAVLAFDRAS